MPEIFFQEMCNTFAQLRDELTTSHCEQCFYFAGYPVKMEIIGDNLAKQIVRPFSHLQCQHVLTECELKVCLWDEQQTDLYSTEKTFDLGKRWEAHEGIFSSSTDGRYIGFWYRHSLTILDRREQKIVGYRKKQQPLSRYEMSKPFFVLLSVWYHDRSIQFLHAGLVAYNGRGVLFPGKGSSGKSTSVLVCVGEGFQCLGDDFIGLQITENEFTGYSIFNSACVAEHHLQNFPAFAPYATKAALPVEDKSTIFLSEITTCEMLSKVPICAIAMPKIVDAEKSTIKRASPTQTLLRLAPSTMFFIIPRPDKQALDRMTTLVKGVPAYWLEIGRDLQNIAHKVRDILCEEVS